MVVLSMHLAALACICAAIPLAVPAEAAHIYRGYLTEKPASSFLEGHRHDGINDGHYGKHHGHQVRAHRPSELPPLLRRHHGSKKGHNRHGQNPRDDAHGKVPRSAFARSRYRRDPVHLDRRSSVYVPGEHGDMYVVSRTPPNIEERGRIGTDKRLSHAYIHRRVDESELVLGRIDIMGDTQPSGTTQRIASLTVDSTPVDWTSGQNSAKAFQLNASTANQTQFIMFPVHDPSNAAGANIHITVTLATEVFDPDSAEMVMYCATYDPDPGATSTLVMTPCTNIQPGAQVGDASDPCADDGSDVSASNLHDSQLFSYDPSTGQIEPMSASASSSGTRNGADDPTGCAGARVRRDGGGNSTTSGSASPSSTSTSATALPSSASQQARNVTLVYVTTALQVPVVSSSSSSSSSSNTTTRTTTTSTSMGIGQAAVFTTTITTTVVATVTASGSSGTVKPPRAAASLSTMTTTAIFPTVSRPPASPSSSAPSATTSKIPVNADESLEVEIVGVTSAVTASSSSTTSSSSSSSPSLDALAMASSIENSWGKR